MTATPGFFRDGAACDLYEHIRDREFYSDTRQLIDELWARYEPLCRDPAFRKKAMRESNACVWQMYIACVLLDHGHVLEPSGDDADIKIRQPDASVVWVEVTTAEAGDGENRAKRIYRSDPALGSAVFALDERKMILRYQNAIRLKTQHRERFIERGTIPATDPYVVALSAADIDDADLDDGLPNIVRAVLPIGPLAYSYKVRTDYSDPDEPFDDESHWMRPHTRAVKTHKGVDSPTTTFSEGGAAHAACRPSSSRRKGSGTRPCQSDATA